MMNKLVQLLQPVEGELEKDVKSAFCFVVMKVTIFKAFLFRIIFNMEILQYTIYFIGKDEIQVRRPQLQMTFNSCKSANHA